MSTETAWTVMLVIAAAGAAFWLITAVSFVALVRAPRESEPVALPLSRSRGIEGPQGDQVQTGRVEVAGRPDELSAKLAGSLSRTGLSGLLTRVLERTADRVVFEVLGTRSQPAAQSGNPGAAFREPIRGEVVFKPSGSSHAVAEFALEARAGRGLVVAGVVLLVLGLIGLFVGFVLVSTLVVPSPNPGIRAQSVQMIQCVHLLWPPWLFARLYRRGRDALRSALEVLLGNLPYL
jgi:hypothetical protein